MDKKVIIVEDNYIIQMFLENSIQKLGCEVIKTTDNSDDLLETLESQKPDIILMDIGIKGNKNGIEAAKIINQLYQLPIVFITGSSDKSTIEKAKQVKPIHIIIKPIDEEMLQVELSIICEKLMTWNN